MPGLRTPGILICACCGANAFYRPHRACAYGPQTEPHSSQETQWRTCLHRTMVAGCVIPKERGKLQCGVCPEKRMAKQECRWTRKVSASLMAITSHLPKGWVSERYSCSDSSACLRLRMRCATPMHSTAPPAIQVKVTPLRPVSGRPTDLVLPTLMVTSPAAALVPVLP